MVDAEKRLSQILIEIGNLAPVILNERQQRLISGSIAKGYGYGGDKIVSEAFGIDPRTVSAGRKAIEAGKIDDIAEDRIRQIGGGRKQAKELQPGLLKSIEEIVRNNTYINMVHPGRGIFGSDFGTTSFVIGKKRIVGYIGSYRRLFDVQGEVKSIEEREAAFLSEKGSYTAQQENFTKIPGMPVAYNYPRHVYAEFESDENLLHYGITRLGMTTANNNLFVRNWHEVNINKELFYANSSVEVRIAKKKWVPYNKGGLYRRWFGNNDFVVNWEKDGYAIKHYGEEEGHIRSTVPNTEYYFRDCITWSKISSGKIALRYREKGSIFDVAGACLFTQDQESLYTLLGFMNSVVVQYLLSVLSPTINFEGGQIASLPISEKMMDEKRIVKTVDECIQISHSDWDTLETSWEFQCHPLI